MPVGLTELPELLPVKGIRWGVAAAGIKRPGRKDVAVMAIAPEATTAAVYTRNAFCAAPVSLAREHGAATTSRYLLINSGNANAGTGAAGMAAARDCCRALAELADCPEQAVLPFSTGVIGEPLPVARIRAALPQAMAELSEQGWANAARAIMTTDIVPKGLSRQIEVQGKTVTITGIAKGSGMIRPDMATMLAYLATDAGVAPALLQSLLQRAVDQSFNSITVDGDTSTNDACVLVATGQAGIGFAAETDAGFEAFAAAVIEVCQALAQAIVRDGEGATKFITIEVQGGADRDECRRVAYTVAHSPLVKTAFFASDPNWGRILAAVGRAGLDTLDLAPVTIHLNETCIVRNGGRAEDYTEAAGQAVMARDEITITIALGRGQARAQVWTTDLSYDYVRINAEYRT
mgnify:CR=1 FL=1